MQNEVCLGENVAKENRKWHLQLGWLGAKELLFRKCILMLTYCFNNKFKNQNKKKSSRENLLWKQTNFSSKGVRYKTLLLFSALLPVVRGWTPGRSGLLALRPRELWAALLLQGLAGNASWEWRFSGRRPQVISWSLPVPFQIYSKVWICSCGLVTNKWWATLIFPDNSTRF